jgi:hypothetical protein
VRKVQADEYRVRVKEQAARHQPRYGVATHWGKSLDDTEDIYRVIFEEHPHTVESLVWARDLEFLPAEGEEER